MLGRYLCRLIGHRINRRRVWHDGIDMRTTCRTCRTPMIRSGFIWRPFNFDRDAKIERGAHPRAS